MNTHRDVSKAVIFALLTMSFFLGKVSHASDLQSQLEMLDGGEIPSAVSIGKDSIKVDTTKNGQNIAIVWRPVKGKILPSDQYKIEFDYTLEQGGSYSFGLRLTNDTFTGNEDLANWSFTHAKTDLRMLSSSNGKRWTSQRQASIKFKPSITYRVTIYQFGNSAKLFMHEANNPANFSDITPCPISKTGVGELQFTFSKNTKSKVTNLTFTRAKDDKINLLEVVRNYANCMIDKGRDTYGNAKSPLFAVAMDRFTFETGKSFEGIGEIRSHDRTLSGANPMHDQNLYQILYALTKITGDEKYSREADKALKWFFENCQSPATGLMTWGEHIGWDFKKENMVGIDHCHEFFRPWVLWEKTFDLAPDAAGKLAMGLWNHQIQNQKTGMFSRHATWSKHGPSSKNEYPRHGGFYIKAWAEAYKRTKDEAYLKAINTLVDMYNRISSKKTECIPCSTNESRATIAWPISNLSLIIDLHDSAKMLPADLEKKIQKRIDTSDKVFLSLKQEFTEKGNGFIAGCNTETFEMLEKEWTHTTPYAVGYGKSSDAQVANSCFLRYKQLPEGKTKEGYKNLIIACADRYLKVSPVINYPSSIAHVVHHLVNVYGITGDKKYLAKARELANIAIWEFIPSNSPLPKASTGSDHYEAITGADSLIMTLLLLDNADKPEIRNMLVFSDR